MNMNDIVNFQMKLLKIAMWTSIFLVMLGGCLYLYQYGSNLPSDHLILAKRLVPGFELQFVKAGLYLLILIQFVRIFFIIGIFHLKKNFLFIGLSLFILLILVISMFFHYF